MADQFLNKDGVQTLWSAVKTRVEKVENEFVDGAKKVKSAETADKANSVAWVDVTDKPTIPTKVSQLEDDNVLVWSRGWNQDGTPSEGNMDICEKHSFIGVMDAILFDDNPFYYSDWSYLINARMLTNDRYRFQMAYPFWNEERLKVRRKAETGWQAWKDIAFTSDIPAVARGNFSATIGMKANDSVDTSITFPSTGNWDVVATSDNGAVVMSVISLTTSGCTIRGTRWRDDHRFGNSETINVHWIAVKY